MLLKLKYWVVILETSNLENGQKRKCIIERTSLVWYNRRRWHWPFQIEIVNYNFSKNSLRLIHKTDFNLVKIGLISRWRVLIKTYSIETIRLVLMQELSPKIIQESTSGLSKELEKEVIADQSVQPTAKRSTALPLS